MSRIQRTFDMEPTAKPGASQQSNGASFESSAASHPQSETLSHHVPPPVSWGNRVPIQGKSADETTPRRGPGIASPGAGRPLADELRETMEASFQADFSSVRVHQDHRADAMGAGAYARGENLHFSPGSYKPNSQDGRRLLGHELAHVVQQRRGMVSSPSGESPMNLDGSLERAADVQGDKAARGEGVGAGDRVSGTAPAGGPVQGGKTEEERFRTQDYKNTQEWRKQLRDSDESRKLIENYDARMKRKQAGKAASSLGGAFAPGALGSGAHTSEGGENGDWTAFLARYKQDVAHESGSDIEEDDRSRLKKAQDAHNSLAAELPGKEYLVGGSYAAAARYGSQREPGDVDIMFKTQQELEDAHGLLAAKGGDSHFQVEPVKARQFKLHHVGTGIKVEAGLLDIHYHTDEHGSVQGESASGFATQGLIMAGYLQTGDEEKKKHISQLQRLIDEQHLTEQYFRENVFPKIKSDRRETAEGNLKKLKFGT